MLGVVLVGVLVAGALGWTGDGSLLVAGAIGQEADGGEAATQKADAAGSEEPAEALDEPPSWAKWEERTQTSDLDGDGSPETLELAEGHLRIDDDDADALARAAEGESTDDSEGGGMTPAGRVQTCTRSLEGGRAVCAANEGWRVSDCLVGDVDGDGGPELVLLTWVRGSYGPSHPFWVEGDTDSWCQHVYLLRYEDGALVPVWMSSALEFEVASVGLDGQQRLHTTTTDGDELVWAWRSWGLALEEPSAE